MVPLVYNDVKINLQRTSYFELTEVSYGFSCREYLGEEKTKTKNTVSYHKLLVSYKSPGPHEFGASWEITIPVRWKDHHISRLLFVYWSRTFWGTLRRLITISLLFHDESAGIILCMGPANERRRYDVTLSLICLAHTQNDPWKCVHNENPWQLPSFIMSYDINCPVSQLFFSLGVSTWTMYISL